MTDTLETVGAALGAAALPVAAVLDQSDDDIKSFVEDLGYILPSVPPSLQQLQSTSQAVVDAISALEQARVNVSETGESTDAEVGAAIARTLITVTALASRIGGLNSALSAELPPAFVAATGIGTDFETRLYDYLIWNALDRGTPVLRQILTLLGILESIYQDENPATFQPAFELKRVRWERIGQLFADPSVIFHDVYGWGTPDLDALKLFNALAELLPHFFAAPEIEYPSQDFISNVAPGAVIDPAEGPEPRLRVPLINLDMLSLALVLYAVPKVAPAEPQGLAATAVVDADLTLTFPLSERLRLEFDSTLELAVGLALVLRPGQAVTIVPNVFGGAGGTPVTNARALVKTIYGAPADAPDKTPVRLLTIGASFLEIDRFTVSSGVGLVGTNDFDVMLEAGLEHGVLMINASEGDGFLKTILPPDGIRTEFAVALGWTRAHGVYFKGSATLEIRVPTHIQLGPISIDSLYIAAGIQGNSFPIEASAGISAKLGPIAAAVERMGLKLDFSFPAGGGNLGPLNLDFKFKPPSGVGLALDVGVVKGGGYLYFDPDKGEYAGALELAIADIVTVKAIGLITTRMPDGSEGFSLLIIITAEFGTGIQLGFGFTLVGVGGLLGLNRTVRMQPLVEGVRSGAVNSIMFPHDVVANAPRIISDLRTIFPPERDKFLIGPMARLGWGTPALITLSLGVIIEIPGNVAIVGVLKVALPTEDEAILQLQVNFAGVLEFDKKRFYFFAALFDSHILFMTIEGEMAVVAAFGQDANFVLSVGGFHPSFSPPPLPVPSPRRVSISILNESNARLRVEGYFAVTTNTAQFGAHVEAFFGLDAFNVQGGLAFDALFQFSPFHFVIAISASLDVRVFGIGAFGIRAKFTLEGPTPWRAHGTGSISLFFFDIDVGFDVTWGEERATVLPPVAVMPILKQEFEKASNWNAILPARNSLLVSLRQLDPSANELVLHPLGTLRVSQRAVPLDLPIDKVGTQKPSDARRFTLTVAAGDLGKTADAFESFAPAQFQDFDDAAKLAKPAFERDHGGIELSSSGAQLDSAVMVKRIVRYELSTIDTNFRRFVRPFSPFPGVLFDHFLDGASVARSPLSNFERKRRQPFDDRIVAGTETFVVALQADNTVFHPGPFDSQSMAEDFLVDQVAQDPSLDGTLHVIPAFEQAA
jgi:Family of unknown function (DUF6603)